MKSTRQLIHLIPCDVTLLRVLKVETQILCMLNSILELGPNLTLPARRLGGTATDQVATRLGVGHRRTELGVRGTRIICYIKVSKL